MPYFGEKGWESFAVSMRGHGGSEPASGSASTMDEQIQDLASLLRTMQRAPILVAHSLGGIVAQRCAHHCPSSDIRRVMRQTVSPFQIRTTCMQFWALVNEIVRSSLLAPTAGI